MSMKNPNSILNAEAFRHVPGLDVLPLARSNTRFDPARPGSSIAGIEGLTTLAPVILYSPGRDL